jgi:predicted dehydrogenase
VHLLDLVTWWMGDLPTSVYARGRRRTSPELAVDDHLEMVLSFPGDRAAHCEMSRAHRPGSLAQRDVLVVGSAGTLSLPWDGDSGLLVHETGTSAVPADATDGFARQLDGWLDAIEGGTALADGEDGVRAVVMAEAAQRSIDSGKPEVITWI